MFRKFMLLAGVVGMISAAGADTIIPGGNVSGTWAASGSPFLIMGEITVPSGQTLNIEPGVQVVFQGHYKLIVNGLLEAIGTEQDSILFTPTNFSEGWYGIRFVSASDSCKLAHCHIEFGNANGATYVEACGGGIECDSTDVTIENCLIENCRADWGGGGIHCQYCSPSILNNTFRNNSADNYGGGFDSHYSNAIIRGNIFTGNTSLSRGGALNCGMNAQPEIKNNLILSNTATYYGGGIFSNDQSASVSINQNTLAGNSAGEAGGGIWLGTGFDISNCILWNNIPEQIYASSPITYSCVQGGFIGIGNISADPLFVSGPDGDFYLSQIAAGQTQQSPCVNTGDPASQMIDGTTRTDLVQDQGIVDMGYHYYPALPPPPPPPVDITLTPFNPPIIIPPTGGDFAFVVTIDNNTDSIQTPDVWTQIQMPGGSQFLSIGPIALIMPPNASIFRARNQHVPEHAAAGNYIYWVFLGDYPRTIVDSDSFPFTKLAGNREWQGADGWISSGEPFPGESVARNDELHNSSFIIHNSPNPFNLSTVLSYQLPVASHVSLRVFDTAGRLVESLVDGWREAGTHEVKFDGSGLAAGIYFARLQAGEYAGVQKMVLLK